MPTVPILSRLFFVLCAALTQAGALALDPERQFYQYEFGYPSEDVFLPNQVFDIAEDHRGFLWLATDRGLIKYDGIEATEFRVSEYPGLASNSVLKVFFDSSNRLFVGTEDGATLFDGERFHPLLKNELDSVHVTAFAESVDGTVWIGSDEGLWYLEGGALISADEPGVKTEVGSLLWHGDRLFVGARGRIDVWSGRSRESITLDSRFEGSIVRDLEAHQGRVWGATDRGLVRLEDGHAVAVSHDELRNLSFSILLSDRDHNLWFASRRTIGRFLPDGNIEVPPMEDDVLGWTPELTDIYEDTLGRHWHASRLFSLGMLRDTPVNRISYSEGLPSPNVTAISAAPDNSIAVATDRGVAIVTGGEVTTIFEEPFADDGVVRAISFDGNNRLLLGIGHQLVVLQRDGEQWNETGPGFEIGNTVESIVAGTDGDIWIGTTAGLRLFDGVAVQQLNIGGDLSAGSLLFDSTGRLWLGTEGGVASIVDAMLQYEPLPGLPSASAVISMQELSNGMYVAATAHHGIFVGATGQWQQLNEDHGIPAEQIIDVKVRGQDLWLVTSGGLFRVVLAGIGEGDVEVLSVRPVATVPRYRPNFLAYCCRGRNDYSAILAQNQMIMASSDGIVTIDITALDDSEVAPRPYLLSVQGQPATIDELQLEPDERDLEIHYSALHLARGPDVQFRYRLLGLSEHWVDAGSDRTARFLSLPAGEFTFELQASILPDEWASEVASISISREPGFFETDAFRFAVWALIVVLGLLLIWAWLAVARKRHRWLENKIEQRTAELRDLNTQLEKSNAELHDTTETDSLTGLRNRRFVESALSSGEFSKKLPGNGILALLDIDYFKRVNDAYGHSAGDFVLSQFAETLESALNPDDLVARWGGEEFLIVCADRDGAEKTLDQVCRSVREIEFQLPNGRSVNLSCSIGCVQYPMSNNPLEDDFATLLDLSDAALYAIKTAGRDGWGLLAMPESVDDDMEPVALLAFRTGTSPEEIVSKGLLTWKGSRSGISLARKDTVTQLHTVSRPEE